MKQKGKKFNLLSLIFISIFFICLFIIPSFASTYLPGDFVGPMGDPTPDGKVDFNDLMVFATAYGSETGDPNWNDICDICGYLGDPTPDGKVNFDDLMLFATNYGKVDYEHFLQIGDEAIEEVVDLTAQYGKTQAYQMIVDYLLEKEGINDAGVTPDGECVWYELDDGFTFSFSEYPEEEEDLIDAGANSSNDSVWYEMKEGLTISISEYPEEKENNSLKSDRQSQNNDYPRNTSRIIPNNSKAIILDWEIGLDNTPNTVRNYLEDAEYFVDYCPRSLSLFTLEKVMDLYQYGVVYICSHAKSGTFYGTKIITGQEATSQKIHYYRQEYGNKVNSMIGVHTFYLITIGEVGFIETGSYFCFYPDFILNFANQPYPESLIYVDVCEGLDLDEPDMAKAFINEGAYVYCSYIGTTRVGCQHDKNVFKWLTIDHLNIEEAISNCADSWLCGSLRYYPEDHGDFYLVNGGTGPVHNLTKGTYYDTIQAALDDADNNNTIEVSDGTYDESITFPFDKVIILQSVNGPSSTIIRGNDDSHTVYLNSSLEGTTLKGFTVTHADGLTGKGMYIYNCANLIINNCTISNNYAPDDFGGGIYNELGTLTITGTTISDNTSFDGGGIFLWSGTLTITESTISNNYAPDDFGGGIFNNGGTITITKTTIYGNTAYGNGGGICNYGPLTITGSTISNNSTTAYNHTGGGIHNYNGTLTIIDSIVSGNSTNRSGGGIYNCYSGTITITGSTISNNSACYYGGGIYIAPTSGIITIGGSSNTDTGNFNEFTNNYKIGSPPSPDQHIRDSNGDCHEDYPYNYFITDY